MVFPRDAVRTSGEVSVFHSSEHGRRYACASCQTPVYSHYDNADETDLYPGALDEPGAFPPTCELWTSRPNLQNEQRVESAWLAGVYNMR